MEYEEQPVKMGYQIDFPHHETKSVSLDSDDAECTYFIRIFRQDEITISYNDLWNSRHNQFNHSLYTESH